MPLVCAGRDTSPTSIITRTGDARCAQFDHLRHMGRTAAVFAMLMLSSPAFGQEEPASPESPPESTQEPQPAPPPPPPPQVVRVPPPAPPPPPPPQYAPQPTMARSSGMFGLQLGGARLSCTGCSNGIFGAGLSLRAGGHIVTSSGL